MAGAAAAAGPVALGLVVSGPVAEVAQSNGGRCGRHVSPSLPTISFRLQCPYFPM